MIDRPLFPGRNVGTIVLPVGSASSIVARAWLNVRCDGGGRVTAWFQKSADSDGPAPGTGPAWASPDGSPVVFRNATRASHEVPSGTEYIQYSVDANGAGGLSVELLAK